MESRGIEPLTQMLQASIAKRKERLERIRERILNFCDNPYSSQERVEELMRIKEAPE